MTPTPSHKPLHTLLVETAHSPQAAPSTRPITWDRREPLHGIGATREAEHFAASSLPPHTLMARAGLAIARLAKALQPHARCIWVACGPGNNGGDGLVAATHLHNWSRTAGHESRVVVTHPSASRSAYRKTLPPDAEDALAKALAAGVHVQAEPPHEFDLAIDAVLGIGISRPIESPLAEWIALLRSTSTPVLCVDVPSGLAADTGVLQPVELQQAASALDGPSLNAPRDTLSLLTLKPGLFTAHGRDAAGGIWLDTLQASPSAPPQAWLHAEPLPKPHGWHRPHANHKGSHGDVAIVGGQSIHVSGAGMTGAALLAAKAALHAGAGRVYACLLGAPAYEVLSTALSSLELMLRTPENLISSDLPERSVLVCGCGGGTAIAPLLPLLLTRSPRAVLDADALNAIARDPSLRTLLAERKAQGWISVLTPHPLEAARLLDCDTAQVMRDRLAAATELAKRFGAICVLKGSGTVVAAPGETPRINGSGNARLATAGTGDVLAGMIGAALTSPKQEAGVFDRVTSAVFQHGWLADHWAPENPQSDKPPTLLASQLAEQAYPLT
jgi:hydroxyethylthiazole kinase-like uncharacterized protein yjeF